MAAKGEGSNESKKRKSSSSAADGSKGEKPSNPKKVKLPSSSSNPNKGPNKPFKSSKQQSQQQQPLKFKSKFGKSDTHGEKTVPKTKRELRLQAKVKSFFPSIYLIKWWDMNFRYNYSMGSNGIIIPWEVYTCFFPPCKAVLGISRGWMRPHWAL